MSQEIAKSTKKNQGPQIPFSNRIDYNIGPELQKFKFNPSTKRKYSEISDMADYFYGKCWEQLISKQGYYIDKKACSIDEKNPLEVSKKVKEITRNVAERFGHYEEKLKMPNNQKQEPKNQQSKCKSYRDAYYYEKEMEEEDQKNLAIKHNFNGNLLT